MKLHYKASTHVILLLLAGVVIAFRYSTVREHAAWQGDRASTLGHIDDIQESTKLRTVYYSFELDGETYKGQTAQWHKFIESTPVSVSYVKADPTINSITPERIESDYNTSVILIVAACLPVLLLWALEVKHL